MPVLPPDFGQEKAWKTLPNGVEITRGVFWGGNVDYTAYVGEEEVGYYHVERYHVLDGNNCEIEGKDRSGLRFWDWIKRLKEINNAS